MFAHVPYEALTLVMEGNGTLHFPSVEKVDYTTGIRFYLQPNQLHQMCA